MCGQRDACTNPCGAKAREESSPTNVSTRSRRGVIVSGAVLLALVAVPAPLLPPRGLVLAVQSVLGAEWKQTYLATALGMHLLFYGMIGMLAAFALDRARSLQGRLLHFAILPCAITALAILVRSLKLGHVPVLTNAIVPAL